MELWKSLLLILKEESVFAIILSFVGASLIVLKEVGEEGEKRPLILITTFFIGLFLSLSLVPVIGDYIELINKNLYKLRPFEYFAMAYFGDTVFDTVQLFIKFLLSKETRKKVFNAILNWLIDNLTKAKSNDN